MASRIPVLPLVGSTMVPPALSSPRRSASSSMATAMRSLTLPPGLTDSSLATTSAPPAFGSRLSRTSGVRPISSRTVDATRGRIITSSLSDVVHRPGHSHPLAHASRELAEREPVHYAGDGFGDLFPQLDEVVTVAACTLAADRFEGRARTLHRSQHRPHRDLLGQAREVIAARGAPLGRQQPSPLEGQQHLLEVALGDVLAPGTLLDRNQPAPMVQSEVEHRLDGVLALRGNPHARADGANLPQRARSSPRATSLAKYVMMMSAPARRMAVRASIMARSSSSQPSCPAALIMAYSPDTE